MQIVATLLAALGLAAALAAPVERGPAEDEPADPPPPPAPPADPSPPPSEPPPAPPRPPQPDGVLACIRKFESGGHYRAVSPSGRYRGAYQFDQETWDAAARRAGTPDLVGLPPEDAPPEAQNALAGLVLADRGTEPWSRRVRRRCG